jgi:nickel-type superoxide dismutase maturation protease
MPPPSDEGSEPSGKTYHRGRKGFQATLAAVGIGAAIAYSFLRWKPFRVEIEGPSMSPTLEPGDWALAVAAGRLRRGDVVVIEHPTRPGFEVVKRIVAVPGELTADGRLLRSDEFWVEGDNQGASTDSRHFGPVMRDRIRAEVRLVYWPPSRRRIL